MSTDELHPMTAVLLQKFTEAMRAKLLKAQVKYGYGVTWADHRLKDTICDDFHRHIDKGDPVDVANYCMFMWHHGWSTAAPSTEKDNG